MAIMWPDLFVPTSPHIELNFYWKNKTSYRMVVPSTCYVAIVIATLPLYLIFLFS